MANYRTTTELKPYMGFKIERTHSNGNYYWKAENNYGYVYESRKSLKDLKERIHQDDSSRKMGLWLGNKLRLERE